MKRAILTLIFCNIICYAKSQINIGLRDSKYAYISYQFKKHYNVKIEHSIYSGKIGTQYIRGILSYDNQMVDKIQFTSDIYYGTPYNTTFYNFGTKVKVKISPIKHFNLYTVLNPHYDSYYHYKTCYIIGTALEINKEIDFFAQYSTIPEYRQNEKRFNSGLNFHVKNITVEPFLSLPLEQPIKSIRVLVNLNYRFISSKK